MARFDLHVNPGKSRDRYPFLVEVQSNFLSALATRLVIPLRVHDQFQSLQIPADLFPFFEIDGQRLFLDTPQMGALPVSQLQHPIGSLAGDQGRIVDAMERVFGNH